MMWGSARSRRWARAWTQVQVRTHCQAPPEAATCLRIALRRGADGGKRQCNARSAADHALTRQCSALQAADQELRKRLAPVWPGPRGDETLRSAYRGRRERNTRSERGALTPDGEPLHRLPRGKRGLAGDHPGDAVARRQPQPSSSRPQAPAGEQPFVRPTFARGQPGAAGVRGAVAAVAT